MNTPDVTTAQLLALLTAIVGQAVAWGWLSDETAQLAVSVGSFAIAAALKIADAVIRHGRARIAAAQTVSALVLEQQLASSSSATSTGDR